MTDRELLEEAANAAGLTSTDDMRILWLAKQAEQGRELSRLDVAACIASHGGDFGWNPLTDDGDALRLAVKLRLELGFGVPGRVYAFKRGGFKEEAGEPIEPDENAATRRVIVRAAAAIGSKS
jgi:hypothetical protein